MDDQRRPNDRPQQPFALQVDHLTIAFMILMASAIIIAKTFFGIEIN